jgi:hypothetical protein
VTYTGPVKRFRPPLGIKPTPADHTKVKAWSVMGIPVREMCVRLGERFKLGKPMSRMSLYHHFRADLVSQKPGPHPSMTSIKSSVAKNITEEMQKMIDEMAKRGKREGG